MANPTTLTDKPAVIDTGTGASSVALDPRRAYGLAHDGEDNAGDADLNTVYLALSASVDADGSEGDDKAKLVPGRALIVGPNVDTLKFQTAAGGPTFTIVPGRDLLLDPGAEAPRIVGGGNRLAAVDSAAAAFVLQMGGIAESTVPTEVADADTVALWLDTFGRQILAGYDQSQGALQTSPLSAGGRNVVEATHAQLTAPGDTAPINVSLYDEHCFQIVVASVDTNVIFGIQASLDGTNYGRLSLADAADQVVGSTISEEQDTVTVDGTYFLRIRGQFKFLKFTFEDENGGTAVTLDVTYMGGAG